MKILKKYKYHMMAFLIPVSILVLYVTITGHKFFDLLVGDAYQQYIYLFDYLKEVLNGDKSIFWSFSRGMGGNMYGAYFYYLSSPLNILLYFIPKNGIQTFIPILCIIKIGLCGFTMYYYLAKRTKNHYLVNLILSLSYALMSYNIVYLFSIMWLDVVFLSPLVILGIDKIINQEKYGQLFYMFFLILSIFSNYYISYMLCIFCVIYFVFRLFTSGNTKNKQIRIKLVKKFFISSLLCGGILAFELLPVASEMTNFYRDDLWKTNIGLNQLILSFNVLPTEGNQVFFVPQFFCSYFVIYGIINILINSKDKKENMWVMSIIIFFILSFTILPLIYLWHGGSFPILYNHRQAFLLSLFLIIIIGEKFKDISKIKTEYNLLIMLIFICFNFSSLIFSDFSYSWIVYIINIIILGTIIFVINMSLENFKSKQIFYIEILIISIIHIILNFKYNLGLYQNNDSYFKERNVVISEINSYNENNNIVRVEGKTNVYLETISSSYSNINYFLSNTNERLYNFFKKSGYKVVSNVIYSNHQNTFMNDILGVKYYYEIDYNDNNINVSHNENSLEIGYALDIQKFDSNSSNPFEFQNAISKSLTGIEVFEEVQTIDKVSQVNKIEIEKEQTIYLFIKTNNIVESCNARINNEEYKCNEILKITSAQLEIYFEKNSMIENIYCYIINNDNYNKVLDILNDNQIYNLKIKKNMLNFSIDILDKKNLLLTIPYDEGYKIYVDGKQVNYYEIFDTFIGIDLEKGRHSVKFIYYPIYLKPGIIISCISLFVAVIYLFLSNKYQD